MEYEQAVRMAQESPRYSESYLDYEVAVREKLPGEGRPKHMPGKERRAFWEKVQKYGRCEDTSHT